MSVRVTSQNPHDQVLSSKEIYLPQRDRGQRVRDNQYMEGEEEREGSKGDGAGIFFLRGRQQTASG